MDKFPDWGATFGLSITQMLTRLVNFLPSMLGAIALLLIGWVSARLLRKLAIRLSLGLDRMMDRLHRRKGLTRAHVPSASAQIIGSVVFWVVILVFLTAATQLLGLAVFSTWLRRVVEYLPTLIAGGLIVLAGFVVSALARDMVVAAAPVAENQRLLLGRIVQGIILASATVIGAQQIGIDVTFLVIIAAVIAVTLFGGVALAVSLGARTFVSNLIGAHYLRQSYQIGQIVRVGEHQGKILDLTPTVLVLETTDGRVTVPAKVFNEQAIVLLIGDDARG
jgi:hypothetical protein